MSALRIGTRRSPLALAQAEEVQAEARGPGVIAEVKAMSTSGDEHADAGSAPKGLKGLWIDAILDALEAGEVDLAVHSAKDLPAEEDEGSRSRPCHHGPIRPTCSSAGRPASCEPAP